MIFFLHKNKNTIPVFFIEKGSFDDLFIVRSSSMYFSEGSGFSAIVLVNFMGLTFLSGGFTSTFYSGTSSKGFLF